MADADLELKRDLLSYPVKHVDVSGYDARPIIEAMSKMSFSSRDLSRAAEIFDTMLRDTECSVILTIAGSASAGGCMQVYSDMLKYNMVDVVVATGASIVDMDFFEALGFRHYQAKTLVGDDKLRQLYIDRIYDTYIDEEDLQKCDKVICDIADTLEPRSYTSREFISEMGKYLVDNAKKPGSLVQTAYECGVPVFCPAFTDSSAGFGLALHQVKNSSSHITIDSIREFRELTQVKVKAGRTGLFMVGGGVPKNFAQDIVVCAEILGEQVEMHKYAIQITVADVRDGACSGSTLKEACSWGKVDIALEQMVYAEATTVVPLLVSDAYHREKWKERSKRRYADIFM